MAERVAFKGMLPSQAASITHEQYLKLVNSRMRRSMKRNGMNYRKLVEKAKRFREGNVSKAVRTHIREAVILPEWIGMKFEVHDGKEFKQIVITAPMLGHMLGEYAYSTKRVLHSAPGIRATRGSKFLAVK